MPAVHFDYVIGSAAIDIFILLTIAIGIIAEMHRPPHQRTADQDRQLRDRHQTLTIDDRTWREPAGVNVINYGVKL